MADFLADLWESVFTPGPTPTLLVATNVTFGALQILLLALLVATYSVHFAILSVLCGGLWYSINWFAIELRAAQKAEADAERLRKKKSSEKSWKASGEVRDSADDEGEDTEVDTEAGSLGQSTRKVNINEPFDPAAEGKNDDMMEKIRMSGKAMLATKASGAQAVTGAEGSRRRTGELNEKAPSELSTDSEWEKVEEGN